MDHVGWPEQSLREKAGDQIPEWLLPFWFLLIMIP